MQYGGEREADHAAALRARREDIRPRQHPHKAGARTCGTGHDTAATLRAARHTERHGPRKATAS